LKHENLTVSTHIIYSQGHRQKFYQGARRLTPGPLTSQVLIKTSVAYWYGNQNQLLC